MKIGIVIIVGLMIGAFVVFKVLHSAFFGDFGDQVSKKSGHYWIKNNVVHFSITDGPSAAGTREMPEIDTETFEVIASFVVRDKNNAYYRD